MLPADIDTLAKYGGRSVVNLGDRRARVLLILPRGHTQRRFEGRSTVESIEGRGSWTMFLDGSTRRRFAVSASMATLKHPFRPCHVTVDGHSLLRRDWRFDEGTRVLSLVVHGRYSAVRATACHPG